MTLKDKILFIENSLNLSHKEFANRYKIKLINLKNLISNIGSLSKEEVHPICNDFNLDIEDFLNEKSTLSKELNKEEHPCKVIIRPEVGESIYEDFAREDNSRYEEKD